MRIGKKDDLTLEPSELLNRETLELMEAHAANAPVRRKKTRLQRMLSCAALVGVMFILMGAGYRVFPQIAYVPGRGIVKESMENVYILQKATAAGEDYIDGVSLIPVTEGEHKGQWEVRVLTTESYGESPSTITFTTADGAEAVLENAYTVNQFTRYTGYISGASTGTCTIGLSTGDYTVEIIPLSQSPYAEYSFPVEQGILAVAYPLSEGSDKIALSLSMDTVSEDLLYWAQHSQYIGILPDWDDFRLTDTKGNTYTILPDKSNSVTIPVSGEKKALYPHLLSDHETIYRLDRRLEAPVASIEFGLVRLTFNELRDMAESTYTIPAEDEKVTYPENTVLLDGHGMHADLLRADTGRVKHPTFHKEMDMFAIWYDLSWNFRENVTSASISLVYVPVDDPDSERIFFAVSGGSSTLFPLTADNPMKKYQNKFPVTYGDTVRISLHSIDLTIEGSWNIDFTKTTEPSRRIPPEVIRRRDN